MTLLLTGSLCIDPSASRRSRKTRRPAIDEHAGKAETQLLRSFPGALSDAQCEQLIAAADSHGTQVRRLPSILNQNDSR
jgi:hypothetical protein